MKLSLDALKEKAEGIASEELLNEITGGNANDCHVPKKTSWAEDWGKALFYLSFGR